MSPLIRTLLVVISMIALNVSTEMLPKQARRSRRSLGTCGISKISSGLINRGQNFSRGSFPWIVALTYVEEQPPMFFCAGTIVSSSFVISAAHCINEKNSERTLLPRNVLGFFGAHNLSNTFEPGRFALSPVDIFLHDKWNPRTSQYDGDVSLLQFEDGSIHFNKWVQPICLWKNKSEPILTNGVVTGWGKDDASTRIHENEPKVIEVGIQSNGECLPGESELARISSTTTFCAGLINGSGVCHGDSGGGLFTKFDGVYHLMGIVSSSLLKNDGCDVSKNAVYTNVIKFSDWIGNIIVPVTANILLPKGREYNIGINISLYCNVTGEPTPDVTWYKDDRLLEVSDHVEIPEPNRIIVVEAQPFDSGNYRCVARNDYSHAFAAEVISVEGFHIPFDCTDNPLFATCPLIVRGNYCNHKYYIKFCCKSCTLAGQRYTNFI